MILVVVQLCATFFLYLEVSHVFFCSNFLVKFRLSDSFVKKTTLCIVPMDKDADGNLTPRVRTLKTMRSVLAGIPIVPPDWIHACGQTNTAVVPLAYYARSLPTKTDAIRESGDGNFGVAKLAALLDGSKKSQQALPLYDACVFLCGNFPRNKRTDIQRLCKEAGANVLTCPSAVTAKLATKHQPVVLVCHDSSTGTVVPRALEKEIKDDASPLVMVVNMNWVFDSITCARTLPADAFEPTNPKAKVLWRSLVDTTK